MHDQLDKFIRRGPNGFNSSPKGSLASTIPFARDVLAPSASCQGRFAHRLPILDLLTVIGCGSLPSAVSPQENVITSRVTGLGISSNQLLTILPSVVAFQANTNKSTISQIVHLTNNSSSVVVLKSVAATPSGAFGVTGWSGVPELAPSQTMTLSVLFQPGPSQLTYSGTVSIVGVIKKPWESARISKRQSSFDYQIPLTGLVASGSPSSFSFSFSFSGALDFSVNFPFDGYR